MFEATVYWNLLARSNVPEERQIGRVVLHPGRGGGQGVARCEES